MGRRYGNSRLVKMRWYKIEKAWAIAQAFFDFEISLSIL
jgi:hypothetical protein